MSPEVVSLLQSGNGDGLPHVQPPRGRTLLRLKLGNAAGTPEVLATIALGVLAAMFLALFAGDFGLPGWSPMAAIGLGLLATGILALVASHDPRVNEMAVRAGLRDRLRADELRDPDIKRLVSQVIAHRAQMERHRFSTTGQIEGMEATLRSVDHWIAGIGKLVQAVEPVLRDSQDHAIQKSHLIGRISELETRIATASSRMTADQLRETMAGRRMQLRAIEDLENQMERGVLRLEHAVSALGAIDAKLAVLAASDDGGGGAQTLAPDINSEIAEIDAVIAAMQRVYSVIPREAHNE